jgi:hypothetical protein
MQATTPAPATPEATTTTSDGKTIPLSIPQSETDVQALYARRQDIRDQINAQERLRTSLVNEIRSAPDGVSRTGLESRVGRIDQDLIRLDQQLSTISQRLDAAPSELIEQTAVPNPNKQYQDGYEEGLPTGIFGTLSVLAAVWLFRWWRGKKKRKGGRLVEADDAPRMQRLEQGMEAIAIEIERISEGQRFVTRLLSEKDPVPLSQNRIAEPVRSGER